MRLMLKFTIPVAKGNKAAKKGTIASRDRGADQGVQRGGGVLLHGGRRNGPA